MSQSAKTLLMMAVLLAIAGGLGLYAYFGVHEKDATTTKQKDYDARLFAPQRLDEKAPDGGAPVAEFVTLFVSFNGKTTELQREPGKGWRITAPVQAAADRLVLDALVSQLQTAKFSAVLDEHPDAEALQRYGLDVPRFVVQAMAQVGDASDLRSVTLEGGIENTFDGSVFMRKNGEPQVYSAPGGVRYALAKTLFDLRDKQLFAVDEVALQKIAVKAKANAYTLERNAERAWALTAPEADLADPSQVAGMLSALGNHRAQKFPDDTPENRAALGLEKPQVDATLTTADGKTIRLRVARGGSPEAVYGLREDDTGAALAEVPEAALGELDRNPGDLKDRTLARFKQDRVTKIVFHNADGTEVVVGKPSAEASAEAWRVLAPREGKAQVFKVTSALWTLAGLRATTVVADKPKDKDLERYGLGRSARSVALFGADGAELARVTIGSPVKDKPGTLYARGTRPAVVEIEDARLREFPSIVGDVLEQPADAGP